jgi:hypothetical protein
MKPPGYLNQFPISRLTRENTGDRHEGGSLGLLLDGGDADKAKRKQKHCRLQVAYHSGSLFAAGRMLTERLGRRQRSRTTRKGALRMRA